MNLVFMEVQELRILYLEEFMEVEALVLPELLILLKHQVLIVYILKEILELKEGFWVHR